MGEGGHTKGRGWTYQEMGVDIPRGWVDIPRGRGGYTKGLGG